MRSIIVALTLACLLPSVGQAASGLGDDPAKFDQLLDSAMVKHDVAFIEAAVADDMRFTHGMEPGGTVWNKQQYVDAVRTYSGLERDVDSVEVERHGDVVETLGHIQVKTSDPQRPEYHIYYVRLYVRGPHGWQFASHRTVRQVTGALPSK